MQLAIPMGTAELSEKGIPQRCGMEMGACSLTAILLHDVPMLPRHWSV